MRTDCLKEWYYTKSKKKFCNWKVMMLSVWWIWALKLKNGTNGMARDKFVKINEMKCEDPFCAEWSWNVISDLSVKCEIWNKSNCFRYYFRDGDTEIVIVLMLIDISIKRRLACIWRELYWDRRFCLYLSLLLQLITHNDPHHNP